MELKGLVFLSRDGSPVHMVYSRKCKLVNRYLTLCGRMLPSWWTPKSRHLVSLSGLAVRCEECREQAAEIMVRREKEQNDAEHTTG